MKRFLFLLALILLPLSLAEAATYWVATTGNNTNSCNSASGVSDPGIYKRDITQSNGGLSCMSPGDTLMIKGGTYSEYIRFDLAGLTLPTGTSDTARITIKRNGTDVVIHSLAAHFSKQFFDSRFIWTKLLDI